MRRLWGYRHGSLEIGPSQTPFKYYLTNLSCCERMPNMVIGTRLRKLREDKDFSQGDIEKRTGLLRCYISRVENGHTVPSLETLERLASALEVPLYQLFY